MKSPEATLEDIRDRALRYPDLAVSLFQDNLLPYFKHRLSYFFLRFGLRTTIFLIEFTLLYFIFQELLFIKAVIARTFLALIGAFWWGATERLREQVREAVFEGDKKKLPKILSSWHSLSVIISVFYFVGVIFYQVLYVLDPPFSTTLGLYLIAIQLRAALQFILLSLHSAVYALQRIYRPVWSIVFVDLLSFVLTLALWPSLGAMSFGFASLCAAVGASCILLFFLKRACGPLPHLHFRFNFHPRFLVQSLRDITPHAFLPALGSVMMNLDSLLVFSLSLYFLQESLSADVISLCYLLIPFLQASHDWAKLFYFDFKKLEGGVMNCYDLRYKRGVRNLSVFNGVIFWSLFLAALCIVSMEPVRSISLALLPLFILRSTLAYAQIRAFSERRYIDLILSGGGLFVMAFALFIFPLELWQKVILGYGAIFATVAVIKFEPQKYFLTLTRPAYVPFARFLQELEARKEPIEGYGMLKLYPEVRTANRLKIKKALSEMISVHGKCSIFGERHILWFTSKPENIDRSKLIVLSGGQMRSFKNECSRASADEIISQFIQFLLSQWRKQRENKFSNKHELFHFFNELFPDGEIIKVKSSPSQHVHYKNFVSSGFRYLRNFLPVDNGNGFYVSALLEKGQIQAVFAIPKLKLEKKQFKIWNKALQSKNMLEVIRSST